MPERKAFVGVTPATTSSLEWRGSPLNRRQHVCRRKVLGRRDSVVLLPSRLGLRTGTVACRLFRFRLFHAQAEFCPHGRMVAQFLLLAPVMVVIAFPNLEVC